MKKPGVSGLFLIGFCLLLTGTSRAMEYSEVYTSPDSGTGVTVLMMAGIYDEIGQSPECTQWIADLEAEGYKLSLIRFVSGTPEEIRAYLAGISGLKGIVLVGGIPAATFERSNTGMGNHPIDIFYMDLDGEFLDTKTYESGFIDGSNGVYDLHQDGAGDIFPEIWSGRLDGSTLENATGNRTEAQLLRDYFRRNHLYRLGQPGLPYRALFYSDLRNQDTAINVLHSNVDAFTGIMTTAAGYRNELAKGYEFVELHAHSNFRKHHFSVEFYAWKGDFLHEQGTKHPTSPPSWACMVDQHSENHSCVTPAGGLPQGDYIMKSRLTLLSSSGLNKKVAILDVYDTLSRWVLASLDVFEDDFDSGKNWNVLQVPFTLAGGEHVSFRTRWLDNADMAQLSTTLKLPGTAFSFNYGDVITTNPKAHFYFMGACLIGNYQSKDYLGGHYVLSGSNGLGLLGQTTAHGMNAAQCKSFFSNVNSQRRQILGEAAKNLIHSLQASFTGLGTYSLWSEPITYLGDPTLSLDPPVPTIVSVESNALSTTLTGTGSINEGSINAYYWRSNLNGPLGESAALTTGNLTSGEHTICLQVRDTLGRYSTEACSTVTITSVAVQAAQPARPLSLVAFPNSFTADITLHIDLPDGNSQPFRLRIFTVNGRMVKQWRLRGTGRHSIDWQPDLFGDGMYIARLSGGGMMLQEKLMVLQ